MKRLLELELAVVNVLAGVMKKSPDFKNIQERDDDVPVILIGVEGHEPEFRIEIVANDVGENSVAETLQIAQEQIEELKNTIRALASIIIGDSIDVLEVARNDSLDSCLFDEAGWLGNRAAAIKALYAIGDDGQQVFETTLARLQPEREEE